MTVTKKPCKDCLSDHPEIAALRPAQWRPAPYPGPRCASHHRVFHHQQLEASHRRRTRSQYGLLPGEYDELLKVQEGACAGCGRVPGSRAKRLAIDHDHTCCPGKTSCGKCVRGLLCHRCNDVLAHFRDNGELLRRLADYIEKWPSWQLDSRIGDVVIQGIEYQRPDGSGFRLGNFDDGTVH
jgi:hypothetical protein